MRNISITLKRLSTRQYHRRPNLLNNEISADHSFTNKSQKSLCLFYFMNDKSMFSCDAWMKNSKRSQSSFSGQKPGAKEQAPIVFHRRVKKLQKDRAASSEDESRVVDYLKDEVASRLVDRLFDIKRRFSTIVDMGSGAGHIIKHMEEGMADKLLMTDSSKRLLFRDKNKQYEIPVERRVMDEELLEFPENSLECVLSNLSLHWVNDLPGSLIQVRRSLQPDGVFIGAMFGGDTLYELRTSLQLAEMERDGGISPHVSPMADVKDMASLLSRAGFSLTTVDLDEIVVNYPSIIALMNDIRAMGEANAVLSRRNYLNRDVLLAADPIYKELYKNEDGSIPATFQIIYMIGWKPDESQPQPKERGSAKQSMKQALEG